MRNPWGVVAIATVVAGACVSWAACGKDSDKPPSQTSNPSARASEPDVRLPEASVSATEILGKSPDDVREALGAPGELDEREHSFEREPVSLTITYGHGLATRLMTSATGVKSAALQTWLGLAPGDKFVRVGNKRYAVITDDSEFNGQDFAIVTLDLAELPDKAPPVVKLLGSKKAAAIKLLKGWEELLGGGAYTDRDDNIDIRIEFDEKSNPPLVRKGDVRYLFVGFREGINAAERKDEILKWLGVKAKNDEVTVNKRRFEISADKLGIAFRRNYLKR